jgi:hypothetical protein
MRVRTVEAIQSSASKAMDICAASYGDPFGKQALACARGVIEVVDGLNVEPPEMAGIGKVEAMKKRRLSGLTESDLETARDNALIDCAETGRGRGNVAFCEYGIKFAVEEVKKIKVDRIKDLLGIQVKARSRCEGMEVFGRPLYPEAARACIGGSASLIQRLTMAKSLKPRKRSLDGRKRRS